MDSKGVQMFTKRSARLLLAALAACGAVAAAPVGASALSVSVNVDKVVTSSVTLASLGPAQWCVLTGPSWVDFMTVRGRNLASGQHFDDVVLTGFDDVEDLGGRTTGYDRQAFIFWGDTTFSAGHINSSGDWFSVDGAHDYDGFGVYHGVVAVGRPGTGASTWCRTPFSVTVLPQGG